MTSDFSYQKLQGKSFRGQNLSDIDFSGADIRGVDFSNSILRRAKLTHVKTGLKPVWSVSLRICLLISAALAGFVDAYASTFPGNILPILESASGRVFASIFTLGSFIAFVSITIKRGLGAALSAFAVIAILALTVLAALPAVDNTRGVTIVLSVAIAIAISGVLAGAIAMAIAQIIPGKWIWGIMALEMPVVAMGGIRAGTEELSENWEIIVTILGSIPTLIILLGLSLYVSSQAVSGNPKYILIYRIAVAVCNYGATSFRGANLSDADFTKANLRNADFRDSILTRTRWFQSHYLAQARISETYLEHPKVRQLVTTLNGQDQNFDNLDLRELNLQSANLVDASLIGAKLSESTLQDADLTRAKLVQAQLYGADLTSACLTGAVIQDWSISTDTNFSMVKCDYVYIRLPTKEDPDPCRKPDNRSEIFQDGDFADFIAPIIKTLTLYRTQHVDPRNVGKKFKTLDLFHHEGIDPTAAAIALKQLARQHPEADLEVVALEGRGDDKVRVQAKVAGSVDRSMLSAEYFMKYEEVSALSYTDLQSLLAGIAEKDERIRSLENMVMTAIESNKFYVETYYHLGDTVSEKNAINISSSGNVSGVVGGNINSASGVVNLGVISGDVTNAIGQLPEASKPDDLSLKELLTQLKNAIESESALSSDDKAEALEQIKTLAEAGKAPEDSSMKKAAKTAVKVLKGTISGLSDANHLVQECTKLIPVITTLLALI